MKTQFFPSRLVLLFLFFTILTLKINAQFFFSGTESHDCDSTYQNASIVPFAIDRFGNCYEWNKISESFDMSGQPLTPTPPCDCANGSGIFKLFFRDVSEDRDYAFDDPIFGLDRQEVVCRAFRDLSELLNPSGLIPDDFVRVEIRESEGSGVNEIPNTNALAVTSPILIPAFQNGIYSGLVKQAIQTEVDPYNTLTLYGFDPNSFHGFMRFNFEDASFFFDASDPLASAVGSSQYDLYTTALHEAIHLLGFFSLIDPLNNNESLLFSLGSDEVYSHYDTYLRTINGTNNTNLGIPEFLKYPITGQPFDVEVGITPSLIGTANCNADVEFHGFSNGTQDIYRPSPWNSSILSHFNCDALDPIGCATNNGYVMNACSPVEFMQRHPSQEEVNTLCDLGYILSTTYGEQVYSGSGGNIPYQTYSSCQPGFCHAIGVNDVLSQTVASGGTISVLPSGFTSNDINTSGYVANSFELYDFPFLDEGTVSDNGNGFTYTSSNEYSGWVSIRYLPICSDGTVGDWATIFLFVEFPDLPPCPDENLCNLLCFGGFDNMDVTTPFINFQIYITQGTPDLFPSSPNTPTCDQISYPSGPPAPDQVLNPGNTKYLGFDGDLQNREGFHFELTEPLILGNSYSLSFLLNTSCSGTVGFHFSTTPPCPTSTVNIGTLLDDPVTNNSLNCGSYTYDAGLFINFPFDLTDIDADNLADWELFSQTFIADGNYENLVIFQELVGSDPNYIYIDEIELINLTEPQITVESTVGIPPCADEITTIEYEICSDQQLTNVELTAIVSPLLATYSSGGNFVNGQTTLAQLDPVGNEYCATVILELMVGNVIAGTQIPVDLVVGPVGICVNQATGLQQVLIVQEECCDPPVSQFTFTTSSCNTEVQFTSIGNLNDTHLWNFGDIGNSTSSLPNPLFDFGVEGVYQVEHYVTNDCGTTLFIEEITIDLTGCPCHCDDVNGFNIGNPFSITDLSSTAVPALLSNTCLSIYGDIRIDIPQFELDAVDVIIHSGVTVFIDPGSDFIIGNSTLIEGCDEMWEAIVVEAGASIDMQQSTVKDGIHAITLLDGSAMFLEKNIFDENYIGVYIPPSAGGPNSQSINVQTFALNQFISTSTLKPPYSGQITYAGVEINEAAVFKIGHGLTTSIANTFSGIRNGVLSFNSTPLVKECVFQNLVGTLPLTINLNNLEGVAIFSQEGAITGVKGCLIDNCHTGIYCENNKSIINNENTIQNVDYGIRYENGVSTELRIKHNTIHSAISGVRVVNTSETDIAIDQNTMDHGTGGSFSGFEEGAVNLFLVQHSEYDHISVSRNNIDLHAGVAGVWLSDCNNVKVFRDTIDIELNFTGNYLTHAACVFYSDHCVVKDCEMTGNGKFSPSWGLNVVSSEYIDYCCNIITDMFYGENFVGVCDNSRFEVNENGENFFGLRIENDSWIGIQGFAGNLWTGSYPAGFGFGAENEETDQFFINLSRFDVSSSAAPIHPPTLCPELFGVPTVACPNNGPSWFNVLLGNDEDCSSESFECGDGLFGEEELIGEEEMAFAQDQVIVDPGHESLIWEAELSLLRRVNNNSEWINIYPPLSDFVFGLTDEPHQQYIDFRDGLLGIVQPSDSFSAELSNSLSELEVLLDYLEAVDNLLLVDPDNDTYLNERGQLLQTIISEGQTVYLAQEAIQNEMWGQMNGLLDNAETLPGLTGFHQNEIDASKIYLQTLLSGNSDLDQDEQVILQNIANQCIRTGGSGVGLARTLLAIMEGEHIVEGDCVSFHQADPGMSSNAERAFEVFPNPNNGAFTFVSSEPFEADAEVLIYSSAGILVKRIPLPENAREININLDGLPNGIYMLQFHSNNTLGFSDRVILHK
jgi:hypothetical protein